MKKFKTSKKVIVGISLAMVLTTATAGLAADDFGLKARVIKINSSSKMAESDEESKYEEFVPVKLNEASGSKEIMTTGKTVREVLKNNGIDFQEESDRVEPGLDTAVESNMEINVTNTEIVYNPVDKEAEFQTEVRENPELELGAENVIQEGSNGIKTVVFRETYENGTLVDSQVDSEVMIQDPVNRIVEKGTKGQEPVSADESASREGGQREAGQEATEQTTEQVAEVPASSGQIFRATAYGASAEENGGYAGITALGTSLRPGVIAVDPSVIPLGTRVYIQYPDGTPWGYGIAEDTGGAIKGNKIDIFIADDSQVYQFGVRDMIVTILD